MSVYAITFGAVFDRAKAEARGLATPGAADTEVLRGLVSAALPDGSAELGVVLAQFFCVEVVRVTVKVTATAGTGVVLTADEGDTDWLVTDTAGTTFLLANGRACIEQAIALGGAGAPLVAVPAITFGGAALVAAFASASATFDVTLEVRPWGIEERISNARAVGFADSAKRDVLPSVAGLLARLESWFNATGGGKAILGNTSANAQLVANGAALALPAPCAQLWIPPSDIGNQNEQIPATVAANTVQHYMMHPGAFYRVTPNTRAWRREPTHPALIDTAVDPPAQFPITTIGGALLILTVVRAPTHSRWFVIIDSAAMIVTIEHPAGSDFRRPRDVWNNVWFPAMAANNAYMRSLPTWEQQDDGTFARVGSVNRLGFLEFARPLEFLDGNREQKLEVPYFQT